MIRSDRIGEYKSPFEEICLEYDIIHQTTAPYTPQSNGLAERKNRTLKEMMNVLMINSGSPRNLWGEAILTSNYSIEYPIEKHSQFHMSCGKEENPT